MAIELLASSFGPGGGWTIDHDDVAGTVGFTVTDVPQQLHWTATITATAGNKVVWTSGVVSIQQYIGQGRVVLYIDPNLVGVSFLAANPKYQLGTAAG